MAKCAKCLNEMAQVQVGNITIDVCRGCGGIWFDLDELMSTIQMESGDREKLGDCLLEESARKDGWNQDPAFCPRCGSALKPQHFDKDLPIIIDVCPQEHGIWLDKGEFTEIRRFYDEVNKQLLPDKQETTREPTREELQKRVEKNEKMLSCVGLLGKVGCAAVEAAAMLLVDSAAGGPMTGSSLFTSGSSSYGTTPAKKKPLKWSS